MFGFFFNDFISFGERERSRWHEIQMWLTIEVFIDNEREQQRE